MLVPTSLMDESLQSQPMPPRTTQHSYRPRASDRTMVGNAATVTLVSFGNRFDHHDCRITLRAGNHWHPPQREANRNGTSKQRAGCRDKCSHVGLREKYFFLTSLFIGHSEKTS